MELRPSLFCLFFRLLYVFLPPFEDLGCFSGCLMSSAGIQKLFCGIYLAFKCSFDEFVGEKVFSPSYSSAILAPPSPFYCFPLFLCIDHRGRLSYLLSKTWVAFLGAWYPLSAFRSCFVEFTWHLNVLLMNLWGRKCSPRPTPPPS